MGWCEKRVRASGAAKEQRAEGAGGRWDSERQRDRERGSRRLPGFEYVHVRPCGGEAEAAEREEHSITRTRRGEDSRREYGMSCSPGCVGTGRRRTSVVR